jgi:phosphohistidine phosphatase
MKRLSVLRHAKSSWDDPDLDDLDRPLNDRGWKAARRIGKEMDRRQTQIDLVIASPATRVRETIQGVREKFRMDAEIHFETKMYRASDATLLSLLRSLPETAHAPLLVGHNPGLERLVIELTSDDECGLRERIAHEFPTAALALIELPAHGWADVEPGSGCIVELLLAKELD